MSSFNHQGSCHEDPFSKLVQSGTYDGVSEMSDEKTTMTGQTRCFHVHEPALNGDLDVRRLCLHRRQHRPLPRQ